MEACVPSDLHNISQPSLESFSLLPDENYKRISELSSVVTFGLKYYSTLYNIGNVASPVGSYILNVCVAGRMYDREAARQGAVAAAGKGVTCVGVRCYKEAFLVITTVTVGAAVVTAALAWRTRGFYAGDIYARFKEGTSTSAGEVLGARSSNDGGAGEENGADGTE